MNKCGNFEIDAVVNYERTDLLKILNKLFCTLRYYIAVKLETRWVFVVVQRARSANSRASATNRAPTSLQFVTAGGTALTAATSSIAVCLFFSRL